MLSKQKINSIGNSFHEKPMFSNFRIGNKKMEVLHPLLLLFSILFLFHSIYYSVSFERLRRFAGSRVGRKTNEWQISRQAGDVAKLVRFCLQKQMLF